MRKRKTIEEISSFIYYHVTPQKNQLNISKQGLLIKKIGTGLSPMIGQNENQPPVIFLTKNLQDAGEYFKMLEEESLKPVLFQVNLSDEKNIDKDPEDRSAFRYSRDIFPSQLKVIQMPEQYINYDNVIEKLLGPLFKTESEEKPAKKRMKADLETTESPELEKDSGDESPERTTSNYSQRLWTTKNNFTETTRSDSPTNSPF